MNPYERLIDLIDTKEEKSEETEQRVKETDVTMMEQRLLAI
jgi:hypothetical protein